MYPEWNRKTNHTQKGRFHLAWDENREWWTGELSCSNQGNCKLKHYKWEREKTEGLQLPCVHFSCGASLMYTNHLSVTFPQVCYRSIGLTCSICHRGTWWPWRAKRPSRTAWSRRRGRWRSRARRGRRRWCRRWSGRSPRTRACGIARQGWPQCQQRWCKLSWKKNVSHLIKICLPLSPIHRSHIVVLLC